MGAYALTQLPVLEVRLELPLPASRTPKPQHISGAVVGAVVDALGSPSLRISRQPAPAALLAATDDRDVQKGLGIHGGRL